MVRRLLLIALLLVSFSGVAYAIDVAATFPCKNGGSVAVTGTFDPVTGAVHFSFSASNCAFENDATASGAVNATGTIVFTSANTANVNLNTVFGMTITERGSTFSANCNQTSVGTFNLATEVFSGTANVTCSGSGDMHRDILELFLKVFPGLDLE